MACLGIIYAYDCLHFHRRDGKIFTGGFDNLEKGLIIGKVFSIQKSWLVRDIAGNCLIQWGE